MVKEFYANMVRTKDKAVYVRGRWISFSREQINQTFNLKERKDGSKFKRLVESPNFQKIVDLLTDGKGKWNVTRKNQHESIARGTLTEQAKVWFYFLSSGPPNIYAQSGKRKQCCFMPSSRDTNLMWAS